MKNLIKSKKNLKIASDMAKKQFSNDKPFIRQIINNSADFLSEEYKLSKYQTKILRNYACKLHPIE
jgi:hypothetical protein